MWLLRHILQSNKIAAAARQKPKFALPSTRLIYQRTPNIQSSTCATVRSRSVR
jgi:hypothetical protein